jgi:hypothetical protein
MRTFETQIGRFKAGFSICHVLCVLGVFSSSFSLGQDSQRQRAQQFKATHDWTDPLTVPLVLSGNFGELRGNHFHTGLDMKTQGREGLPVLAATDGVLARIKMSPWGYGNALYLEGPDGITTVYAHLQRFAPKLQAWAVERTYAGRSLGLDAMPPASAGLTFQAGDTLGWSGNSGGSGGPHLHFEVRDTPSQHPLNPLQGWVTKSDSRPPSAPSWWLESERGLVSIPARGVDTVVVDGEIRISIEAYDRLDGASNICGIHRLDALLKDSVGDVLWKHRFGLDELNFSVNKDMNAHTLFPVWSLERDQVHRIHRLRGNRLDIYAEGAETGIVALDSGEVATLVCTVWDVEGNQTERILVLQGGQSTLTWANVESDLETPQAVSASETRTLSAPQAKLTWDKQTFFEPTTLGWRTDSTGMSAFVWPEFDAWRGKVNVEWALPSPEVVWGMSGAALPQDELPGSNWVAVQEVDGQIKNVVAAQVRAGAWHMALNQGGAWRMVRDTVVPAVIPYHSGTPIVEGGDAVWFVEDLLAGVEALTLTIGGQWARLVWDPKRNMATYEATDGRHPSGSPVQVELKVMDGVGNTSAWAGALIWP